MVRKKKCPPRCIKHYNIKAGDYFCNRLCHKYSCHFNSCLKPFVRFFCLRMQLRQQQKKKQFLICKFFGLSIAILYILSAWSVNQFKNELKYQKHQHHCCFYNIKMYRKKYINVHEILWPNLPSVQHLKWYPKKRAKSSP